MWNYIPNINKVVKIPPSMMMANWMGSDFTNDDIVRESSFISDYHYSEFSPPEAEEGMMYLELIPKEGVVTLWKKLVMTVDRKNLLPVEQRYVDEKERVMKKMLYDRVKVMDGKEIPTRMTMVPLSEEKKGHRTTVEYLDIDFEAELDDDLFSLRNLRKRR
jgi:outer membrane lipoprotein-sorting protein